MKTLLRTLFIIAFLILITQTIRHGYQRWFRPTISVLDRFEETLKGDIKKAKSIDELALKYEDVVEVQSNSPVGSKTIPQLGPN